MIQIRLAQIEQQIKALEDWAEKLEAAAKSYEHLAKQKREVLAATLNRIADFEGTRAALEKAAEQVKFAAHSKWRSKNQSASLSLQTGKMRLEEKIETKTK